MITETIQSGVTKALQSLGLEGDIRLEHPADLSHGDYSTNVAFVLAKKEGENPRALAEKICVELNKNLPPEIEKIEIAGPGFINFYLSKIFFIERVNYITAKPDEWGTNKMLAGKKIMVEYTDPNPFKPFHIGHLMTNTIGESIARITEANGATVVRANYQGDVGLHVAKAIYGMLKEGGPDGMLPASLQAEIIGTRYSWGSNEYDTNEETKKEIDAINKKIYEKSDSEINILYEHGRKVTLEAFEEIYKLLGTKFVHYFFESDMAVVGAQIVKEHTGPVFEESDGAIVFYAERYNPKLNPRVFITGAGLPTYECKELGLTKTKFEKENPDLSIVITAIEQDNYMKVVTTALSVIAPDWASRMKHITHGMMRLTSGKMSSRKGNIITGESIIRDSIALVAEKVVEREMSGDDKKAIAQIVGVAALKYSILKSSIGSDIVYDPEKSISFEGDSGPYLQYTAVRAQSIIAKAGNSKIIQEVEPIEGYVITNLEKIIYGFEEVVIHAKEEFQPHHITTYLTKLASEFNSFYANTKILVDDNPYKDYHLVLVSAFYITMRNGLYLLGIQTPEKM